MSVVREARTKLARGLILTTMAAIICAPMGAMAAERMVLGEEMTGDW